MQLPPPSSFRQWLWYGAGHASTLADTRVLFYGGLLCLLLALTGCKTAGFYGQAAHGQWRLLADRQPVKKLLAEPATDPALKEKFELLLRLRDYAAQELKLPVANHYLSYVNLHREHVVWTVQAAPEFSLASKTWWYPFVGSLKYRGYFAATNAFRLAAKLQQEGYDVHVGGVDAYSTLGWFPDPVLSSFIHYDEPDLAAVLFHELAHQQLFVSGDTDFNEAFATVVEEEGVRRWLRHTGQTNALQQYEEALRREGQCRELLDQTRTELQQLYERDDTRQVAQGNGTPAELSSLRQEKTRIMERLRTRYQHLKNQWDALRPFDRWMNKPINNAKLASVDTYYKRVPELRRLLEACGGDFAKFYQTAKKQ